jgi:regulator of replication initiation timing
MQESKIFDIAPSLSLDQQLKDLYARVDEIKQIRKQLSEEIRELKVIEAAMLQKQAEEAS